MSGLSVFEKNRSRKRQATTGLNDRPAPTNAPNLNTPRSQRFKNIFKEANPGLLEITRKLYETIEGAILLPKKGGEKISSLGSETAADIKILAATVLDLVERSSNIPSTGRNTFSGEDDDHQIERSLAGSNAFGCTIPAMVETRLDHIDKTLSDLMSALKAPNKNFTFKPPSQHKSTTPSYALAASKHAPNHRTSAPTTPFQPVLNRKTPAPPPGHIKTTNTITLVQAVKDGKELATENYPTIITRINAKLTEAMIKLSPTDPKPIQIRSVHRHPSNDLVLYTTTPEQAEALRRQPDKWIPLVSQHLTLHNPVHTIVVHGIPTSFNPSDPQHMLMFKAMNPDTMEPAPTFVNWISPHAVQRGATHSSLRIGFADAEQAKRTVETKVFYGRFNKKTEFGRKNKPRCMNCLQDGHITRYCKEPLMCPYCAEPHAADKCELHGRLTSNCTACARQLLKTDPTVDLKSTFADTPRHLRHSPLDPTCPARIAEKLALAAKAAQQTTPPTPGDGTAIMPTQGVERGPQEAAAEACAEDTDANMNQSC